MAKVESQEVFLEGRGKKAPEGALSKVLEVIEQPYSMCRVFNFCFLGGVSV